MAEEEKLNLEVVSPEKLIMSKSVDMVSISGTEGDFGLLPGHTALVSSIRPGLLKIEVDKEIELFFISGGFIEVINDQVSILATEVISSNDINIDKNPEFSDWKWADKKYIEKNVTDFRKNIYKTVFKKFSINIIKTLN